MKSGSNLEKVLKAGHFAFTGEVGPPRGANVEAVRKKRAILRERLIPLILRIIKQLWFACPAGLHH